MDATLRIQFAWWIGPDLFSRYAGHLRQFALPGCSCEGMIEAVSYQFGLTPLAKLRIRLPMQATGKRRWNCAAARMGASLRLSTNNRDQSARYLDREFNSLFRERA